MDNQQESSKQIRLSWLGGIIDGEGTITMRLHRRNENSTLITPVITMVNTDNLIIDRYSEILAENNIAFWASSYKQTKNWKPRKMIGVYGLKRCAKALPILIPYLVAKQELGKIVYDWCIYRLTKTGLSEPYTNYDLEILAKVKEFHGHKIVLKSSETICGIEDYSSKDIVRTE